MLQINFLEVTPLRTLKKRELKNQIKELVMKELKKPGDINVVFCSDAYLLQVNQDYLKHDYYTDIITFDYSERNLISGDLFISLDRLRENATINKVSLNHELHRVVFHGTLHLCGYKDKSKADKFQMTSKENFYLQLFQVA